MSYENFIFLSKLADICSCFNFTENNTIFCHFAFQVNVSAFKNLYTVALENDKNTKEKPLFCLIRRYSKIYILVVGSRVIEATFAL